MPVTVSARHVTLDDRLRTRAGEVLDRLGRLGGRVLGATAVFDCVAGIPWVEVRVHCRGGRVLVATAVADNHRRALDKVDRKSRRQLRRLHTRPLALRHASAAT